jgi:carboxyl-terminal processing protease
VDPEENPFTQVVLFSEVLSLVLDNYVDPLEAERLLGSAYEGMLGGLDVHGAYLTPAELAEWKHFSPEGLVGPGFSVLQAGGSLQIVAVDPESPAAEAGLKPGDQIRRIDGRLVREMSIDQSWRLLQGRPGSPVVLDVFHPSEGFRREQVEVARAARRSRAFELEVERGVAVLRLFDMSRVEVEALKTELADVRSRGVERLLVDLRNTADLEARAVAPAAGLFASGVLLQLRDGSGEVVESLSSPGEGDAWSGSVDALVNGATAGSAEALAAVVQSELGGRVLGEPTYGLGAELGLFELEDGSGLLVSSALWETAGGGRWNSDGVQPDEVIHGKGSEFAERLADQLRQALDVLEKPESPEGAA